MRELTYDQLEMVSGGGLEEFGKALEDFMNKYLIDDSYRSYVERQKEFSQFHIENGAKELQAQLIILSYFFGAGTVSGLNAAITGIRTGSYSLPEIYAAACAARDSTLLAAMFGGFASGLDNLAKFISNSN